MRKVEVAIIGAGTAGLSARSQVAKFTDNYVVIDDGPLGTTCARVGCMPSKVLIQIANDFHRRKNFEMMGISGAETLSLDPEKAMNYVRSLRDRFVRGVFKGMESWQQTHLIRQRSVFLDAHTLQAGDEIIEAKKIIIATGSSPVIPGPWRQYSEFLVDTNQFFELEKLPKRVGVIGLGVIGIELGQALNRMGLDVVGITLDKAIGGITDPELQDYIAQKMQEEMPISFEGAEFVKKTETGVVVRSGGQEWEFDKVLVAIGRAPNVKNLGLENLNIELDAKGQPLFDASTYKLVGQNHIYFVGDVNADRPILHEAADEGRIVGYNSMQDKDECFQRRTLIGVTFSDPNIAFVGKRHKELIDEAVDFVTGKVSFEGQGRAIVKAKEIGQLHVYVKTDDGQILGAELFAPEGEHLAHLIAWAIETKQNIHRALSMPFYHPVVEEGLRTAFRDAARQIRCTNPPLEVLRCQDMIVGNTPDYLSQ